MLAVLLLAAVAVLGYHLATSPGRTSATATGYSLAHPHRRARPPATPAPRPTPTPTPAPTPAPTSLTPVTVVAFGPGGPSTGDNPQQAAQAIDGSAAAGTGWQTNWYLSPDFGNLQAGTGLLLDLGQTETVTSVQVTLGPTPGATLQLRAGSAPALADLATVARATDAEGCSGSGRPRRSGAGTCCSGSPGCRRTAPARTRRSSTKSPCRARRDRAHALWATADGRCPVNQSRARPVTASRAPGSSNRWVAPGTMAEPALAPQLLPRPAG